MVRAAGFVVGLVLVAVALVAWRPAPADGTLGTDLAFHSISGGSLAVSPSGNFAQARALGQGDSLRGKLRVANPTRTPLRIQLRAPADRPDLDRAVQVEARAGGRLVFRGPLSGLRRWTSRTFVVPAGEQREVELQARVRRAAEGRFAMLHVEFRSAPR